MECSESSVEENWEFHVLAINIGSIYLHEGTGFLAGMVRLGCLTLDDDDDGKKEWLE